MSGSLRSMLIAAAVCLAWAMPAAAQQGWTGEVTDLAELPGSRDYVDRARIAVDPNGNAIAVWDGDGRIQAARFAAASRTWGAPVDLGFGRSPTLLMDPSSNAIVFWTSVDPYRFYAARYAAAAGVWTGIAAFSPDRFFLSYRAIIDGAGNLTVVWVDYPDPVPDSHVWAARYTASSGTWTITDLSPEGALGTPDLGMDAAGNVTAIWNGDVYLSYHLHPYYPIALATKAMAARFTPATGAWGPVTELSDSGPTVTGAQIAADAEGNVTAMWLRITDDPTAERKAQSARYSAAGGGWSAPVDVATGFGISPILESSPAGTVLAVWAQSSPPMGQGVVQASAYQAATGTWSLPSDLSTWGRHPGLNLAVDSQGNATAVWVQDEVIQASRYAAITGTWSGAVDLAAVGPARNPQLALDPAGNVLAYWQRGGDLPSFETARWSASTGTWGAVTRVAGPVDGTKLAVDPPQVAVDRAGNAIAVWRECAGSYTAYGCLDLPNVVKATQWRATPAAPVITDVGLGDGSLSVTFDPPATIDSAFGPLNYEYSIDDGATWTARVPASTASPLVIASLTSGLLYSVRLRAVNVAGAGAASPRAWSSPGPAPGPPVDVTAMVTGTTVTLHWSAAAYAVPPTSYLVEGGLQPGTTAVTFATASTQFTLAAPIDSFYVRVRAVAGSLQSAPSQEVRVYVFTPGPPGGLAAVVIGRQLTLSWTAPPNSVAPTSYVVEGGLQPGQMVASLPTGSSDTHFTILLTPGRYRVRVRALVGAVKSAASNEVAVTVPLTPPAAPFNLLGLVNGSEVTLSWMNPPAGGLPDGVRLSVIGLPGGPTTLTLPAGESFTFAGVPPGTHAFQVTAFNGAGSSASSSTVFLSFPGACSGAPKAPSNFHATRSGNVITATWDLPRSGPAVTGYTVLVTGSYVGTLATTARSISGPVGPGSYSIAVAATNPCGAGPPTAPQTVVVP